MSQVKFAYTWDSIDSSKNTFKDRRIVIHRPTTTAYLESTSSGGGYRTRLVGALPAWKKVSSMTETESTTQQSWTITTAQTQIDDNYQSNTSDTETLVGVNVMLVYYKDSGTRYLASSTVYWGQDGFQSSSAINYRCLLLSLNSKGAEERFVVDLIHTPNTPNILKAGCTINGPTTIGYTYDVYVQPIYSPKILASSNVTES